MDLIGFYRHPYDEPVAKVGVNPSCKRSLFGGGFSFHMARCHGPNASLVGSAWG